VLSKRWVTEVGCFGRAIQSVACGSGMHGVTHSRFSPISKRLRARRTGCDVPRYLMTSSSLLRFAAPYLPFPLHAMYSVPRSESRGPDLRGGQRQSTLFPPEQNISIRVRLCQITFHLGCCLAHSCICTIVRPFCLESEAQESTCLIPCS
jgi:hypothetical protein